MELIKRNKFGFYILALAVVLLPWDKIYGSIAIALATIYSIYNILSNKSYKELVKISVLSCVSLYLVYVLGLYNTENIEYGTKFLGSKIALVLFPIIIIGFRSTPFLKKELLFYFAISYSIRAFYVFVNFVINLDFKKKWYFQEIENNGGFHATYMSIYSLVTVILLLWLIKDRLFVKSSKFLILFHIVFIILLASRITIIALFITALVYSASIFYNKNELRRRIAMIFFVCFSMAVIGIIANKDIKYKFLQLKSFNGLKYNKFDANSVSTRVAKWKSAIQISKENPILGCGTGDLPDELLNQYRKLECLQCIVKKYNNPHNQYLDALSRNGIIGLLSLLFLLSYPLCIAIRTRNIYMLLVNLVFWIVFMTECVLNVEKGVEFFSFINSFLLFYNKKNAS